MSKLTRDPQEVFDDAAAARGEPRQLPPLRWHPAAELFPMLGETELGELAADIKANGLLRPLVRWPSRGIGVDGRNRLAACKLAGVAPRWEELEFKDDGEAARFVLSVNLQRRHLTPAQRAALAVELKPFFSEAAKERQRSSGGDRKSEEAGSVVVDSSTTDPDRSKAIVQAAQAAGAGVSAAKALDQVKRQAPEVLDAVKAGKVGTVEDARRLAALPPERRASALAKVDRGEAPKAALAEERRAARTEKIAAISAASAPLPTAAPSRYPVIYADPPWSYDQHKDSNRGVTNQYPTMATVEICLLRVAELATPDAVLFLWATSPLLPDAFQVLEAWGFSYRASWVWVKTSGSGEPTRGMGFWGRVAHEFVLIAVRGDMPPPPPEARPPSVFMAPRAAHSAKPFSVRQAIETAYPELPRIELFAREAAPGWSTWGNQAPGPEEGSDA